MKGRPAFTHLVRRPSFDRGPGRFQQVGPGQGRLAERGIGGDTGTARDDRSERDDARDLEGLERRFLVAHPGEVDDDVLALDGVASCTLR